MVRITPEVVENAPQYTNAIRDRELDLRGYKFSVIENLGSTLDQFDTIDLSDNEIRKLDGFPLLKRLKSLKFNNNKIVRVSEILGQQIPNLETLILSGNPLSDLKDLDSLSSCEKLDFLSLQNCPVTMRANYRLYVISRVPALRYLDFRRVTQAERKLAKSMFKRLPSLSNTAGSKVGGNEKSNADHQNAMNNNSNNARGYGLRSAKTFIPGAPLNNSSSTNLVPPGTESNLTHMPSNVSNGAETKENVLPSAEQQSNDLQTFPSANTGGKRPHGGSSQDLYAIQEAIKRAHTMDEVERLHQLLSSGQIAGFASQWQKQLREKQQQQQQQQQ